MAAPNYSGYRWQDPEARAVVPERREAVPDRDAGRELRRRRAGERELRRRDARRRRSFVFIVLVPIILMLGSVYLHTVAADVGARTSELQEEISGTQTRQEALDVRESQLSDSERIRSIASDDLGMKDPDSRDFGVRTGSAADWISGGSEERQREVR